MTMGLSLADKIQVRTILCLLPYIGLTVLSVFADCCRCLHADQTSDIITSYRVVLYGWSVMSIVFAVGVSLKVDGAITWSWNEVFWPVWMQIAVSIGIGFVAISMLLNQMCASGRL